MKDLKLNAYNIKRAISPHDFYSFELSGAKLKKHEWNDGGICPFHDDKNPGSFRVNLNTGAYKCFACRSAGGDVIAFTMAIRSVHFIEALKQLASDWGLV
ncbi:MAG: CHC2 zinc finger domain-containing protein [Methylobacter sp.]|nr:CHC2 zinc finger domain-containing protein [Candidatus Methylobacter titanis]